AGPMEGWAQFHMDPPEVPRPARGKLFLRKFLGSAGLEMSLNVVPPSKGIPFLHTVIGPVAFKGSPELFQALSGQAGCLLVTPQVEALLGPASRPRPLPTQVTAVLSREVERGHERPFSRG